MPASRWLLSSHFFDFENLKRSQLINQNLVIYMLCQLISAIFFIRQKLLFQRNSVTYGTPCFISGHLGFQFYPCYLYDTTPHSSHQVQYQCYLLDAVPCQWFSRYIMRVLHTDQRDCFLLSGIFNLALLAAGFKASLRPPGLHSDLHSETQSRPICLNHTNSQ